MTESNASLSRKVAARITARERAIPVGPWDWLGAAIIGGILWYLGDLTPLIIVVLIVSAHVSRQHIVTRNVLCLMVFEMSELRESAVELLDQVRSRDGLQR